jgi:hypothetical protein
MARVPPFQPETAGVLQLSVGRLSEGTHPRYAGNARRALGAIPMTRAVALIVLVAAPLTAADPPFVFGLAKADLGKLPTSWEAAKTGDAEGSVWKVVADDTAPSKGGLALAQTAAGPENLFNLCVATKGRFGNNVTVSVSLKPVEGKLDQGGGVVWLYQDPNNYYLTRYNPLEENFRVYKVVGGKRTQLGTVEKIKAEPGWHAIKATHLGKEITCTFDDKYTMSVNDDTFQRPGLVGLWTKADARTRFDRFTAAEFRK